MKRLIGPEMIIGLLAIFLLFVASPVSAEGIVDQEQWTSNGTHGLDIPERHVFKVFDQSITAGMTGCLTNVEFEATIETNNVFFYIVDGGRYGGGLTPVFYVNLEPGDGVYNIDVSSAGLCLNYGDSFSIGFQSYYVGYGDDDGDATTNGSFSAYFGEYPESAYAGGHLYYRYGWTGWLGLGYDDDMKFRTYVTEVTGDIDMVQGFVTRFYQLCLSREPDTGGFNSWVFSLLVGSRTGADVAKGFILSLEFTNKSVTDEEYLHILYEAFFNRPPDTDGYNYWLDQLRTNGDREQVLDGFIYSREFANLCFEYGISPDPVFAFVTRFYKLCLDRDPDQAGLDDWVSSLKNGSRTGADVAYGFVFSQEFTNMNTSNEQYLDVLYHAFFNRDPDQGGYDHWLSQLNSGASRENVLNEFIYAQEFYNLCNEYGITPY